MSLRFGDEANYAAKIPANRKKHLFAWDFIILHSDLHLQP